MSTLKSKSGKRSFDVFLEGEETVCSPEEKIQKEISTVPPKLTLSTKFVLFPLTIQDKGMKDWNLLVGNQISSFRLIHIFHHENWEWKDLETENSPRYPETRNFWFTKLKELLFTSDFPFLFMMRVFFRHLIISYEVSVLISSLEESEYADKMMVAIMRTSFAIKKALKKDLQEPVLEFSKKYYIDHAVRRVIKRIKNIEGRGKASTIDIRYKEYLLKQIADYNLRASIAAKGI